jgi:SPP1 family predicted phage head-tail adaptor
MLHDEFPHSITVLKKNPIQDKMGGIIDERWGPSFEMKGFMDTPSSRERYEAQQLKNPLDRYLFYPYRTDIDSAMRITYEDEMYELAGRPEDQGGQHEIMRVALKLIDNEDV